MGEKRRGREEKEESRLVRNDSRVEPKIVGFSFTCAIIQYTDGSVTMPTTRKRHSRLYLSMEKSQNDSKTPTSLAKNVKDMSVRFPRSAIPSVTVQWKFDISIPLRRVRFFHEKW